MSKPAQTAKDAFKKAKNIGGTVKWHLTRRANLDRIYDKVEEGKFNTISIKELKRLSAKDWVEIPNDDSFITKRPMPLLHKIADSGQLARVPHEILEKIPYSDWQIVNSDGRSAIHLAIVHNDPATIPQKILDKIPADIYQKVDNYNQTPLCQAIYADRSREAWGFLRPYAHKNQLFRPQKVYRAYAQPDSRYTIMHDIADKKMLNRVPKALLRDFTAQDWLTKDQKGISVAQYVLQRDQADLFFSYDLWEGKVDILIAVWYGLPTTVKMDHDRRYQLFSGTLLLNKKANSKKRRLKPKPD